MHYHFFLFFPSCETLGLNWLLLKCAAQMSLSWPNKEWSPRLSRLFILWAMHSFLQWSQNTALHHLRTNKPSAIPASHHQAHLVCLHWQHINEVHTLNKIQNNMYRQHYAWRRIPPNHHPLLITSFKSNPLLTLSLLLPSHLLPVPLDTQGGRQQPEAVQNRVLLTSHEISNSAWTSISMNEVCTLSMYSTPCVVQSFKQVNQDEPENNKACIVPSVNNTEHLFEKVGSGIKDGELVMDVAGVSHRHKCSAVTQIWYLSKY